MGRFSHAGFFSGTVLPQQDPNRSLLVLWSGVSDEWKMKY